MMNTLKSRLCRLFAIAGFSLFSLAIPLTAATISYTGNLDPSNPNDVFLVSFVVANAAPVVIRTFGFGGSANAPGGKNGGSVIAPGGFDAHISVFKGPGPAATLVASNDQDNCPRGAVVSRCLFNRKFKGVNK